MFFFVVGGFSQINKKKSSYARKKINGSEGSGPKSKKNILAHLKLKASILSDFQNVAAPTQHLNNERPLRSNRNFK